jgi:ATP/maltotriose-dependent transcriptional regulator MalT
MALCLRRLGELARTRHNFIAARSLLEESLAILRETDNKGSLAYTLSTLAPTLNQQGEYSRARIQAEESLALFREVNNPGGRAYALRYFAEAIFFQGEYATAQAVAMEGLATSRELGDKWQIASSLHLLGQLALHQHEQARAQSLLTESLESYRELGSRWSSAKVLALLASIAAFQQDEAHACALIEQSLTILKEVEDQELLAAFLEELGMEVVVQGGPTWAAQLWGAAEHLREVIEAPFSLVEYPTYERAVSLARLHLGEKAFTTAWEEGRTMSLEQVLAAQGPVTMLAHIPAEPSTAPPVPKASTYPDRLTAREVEVLRLVAQGLTDPQVAEQLVISPHTVNSHLKAIYGKLGISSRSAATRYAIEHHLL